MILETLFHMHGVFQLSLKKEGVMRLEVLISIIISILLDDRMQFLSARSVLIFNF